MKLKIAQLLPVAIAVWLSAILVLYLAPSKYFMADILAALLLVIVLAKLGLSGSGVKEGIKPLAPLAVMLIYVFALGFLTGPHQSAALYGKELLAAFVPFMLFYVIFRNQPPSQVSMLTVAVFLIPGLVHLAFMYLDIFLAIRDDDVPFMFSSRHGLLEYVKDVPRVGRRYLSLALLHLLCAGLLMVFYLRRTRLRYWAWALVSLSVLSLVLLDARAAYASVLVGGALLVMAVGPTRVRLALKSSTPTGMGGRFLLVCLLIAAAGLGYSAGKSRWVAMGDSIAAAVHDVYHSELDLSQRPYVNAAYWDAPIEDVDRCYRERHFRCKIDQSAYLRTAWLLSGLQSLVEHPWGIGYSEDYMARLWGVSGQKGKYQRADSFLVEHMVSFGLVGIMLYGLLVWGLLRSLRYTLRLDNVQILLMAVGGLILVSVGRGLVDVLTEGLWRYLMTLLGMYYGLLHSNELRIRN